MSSPLKFDKSLIVNYSAEFMVYLERHKLLDIISRILAELAIQPVDDVRLWMGRNVRRIAQDFYAKTLDAFHRGVPVDCYQLPSSFFHRIVLHGRPGSGRRSMGHALAQRWNLLMLDAEALAYHHINGHQQDENAKLLQSGIESDNVVMRSEAIGNIIQQRLLKEDALHRGWLLYNYPNNRCEARQLFEGFTVPPNRLIFLQIDEPLARMRLSLRNYAPSPQDNFTYLERQMRQFRKSEPHLNAYLSQRREVVYVDATVCFEAVKCQVMSHLTKMPYMLGLKYGESNALV